MACFRSPAFPWRPINHLLHEQECQQSELATSSFFRQNTIKQEKATRKTSMCMSMTRACNPTRLMPKAKIDRTKKKPECKKSDEKLCPTSYHSKQFPISRFDTFDNVAMATAPKLPSRGYNQFIQSLDKLLLGDIVPSQPLVKPMRRASLITGFDRMAADASSSLPLIEPRRQTR